MYVSKNCGALNTLMTFSCPFTCSFNHEPLCLLPKRVSWVHLSISRVMTVFCVLSPLVKMCLDSTYIHFLSGFSYGFCALWCNHPLTRSPGCGPPAFSHQSSTSIYLRRKPPWTSESIVTAPSRVPKLQQHLFYLWHPHTRVWQNLTEPSAITQLSPSLPEDRTVDPRPAHSQLCFLTWGFPATIPAPVLRSSSLPPPGNHALFPL